MGQIWLFAIICSRCKREFPARTEVTNACSEDPYLFLETQLITWKTDRVEPRVFNLCPECNTELIRWLKNGRSQDH